MAFLRRIREFWMNAQKKSRIVSRSVLVDDWGVTQSDWLGGREMEERIAWTEVEAVLGYKQDLFTVDMICIALVDASGRARIVISEEDAGYQALIDELPRRLAGCLSADEWLPRVAFPTFEVNSTELYQRACENPPQ